MIKYKSLNRVISENFNISECIVLAQTYRKELQFFSTKGNPRKTNGFLYLLNCNCTYTMADGTEIHAKKDDIVYLPAFCEYKSHYKNFTSNGPDGILINLLFTDSNKEAFYLPNKLKTYSTTDFSYIISFFNNILNFHNQPLKNFAEIKAIAYRILSILGTTDKENKLICGKYNCIYKGISYLENDIQQSLSIKEIAETCHVTPTYFRKLFKEYSGMSPSQFRIRKKIDTAKTLLLTNDMSIQEISDYLGFENISYFSKLFKQNEKISPLQYKKIMQEL